VAASIANAHAIVASWIAYSLAPRCRTSWGLELVASWKAVSATADVRTAGQYAHNRDEFALLQAAMKPRVKIYTSVFEFCGTDPPLSWHLDKSDRKALDTEWGRDQIGWEWSKIVRFLEGRSLSEDMPEPR
jgi:hypothetical protein